MMGGYLLPLYYVPFGGDAKIFVVCSGGLVSGHEDHSGMSDGVGMWSGKRNFPVGRDCSAQLCSSR